MINLIKQAVYYVFGKPNYGYQEVLKTEIKEKSERELLIEKYKNCDFLYSTQFFEHPIFSDIFYKKVMSYDYKKENQQIKDTLKNDFLSAIKKPAIFALISLFLFIVSLPMHAKAISFLSLISFLIPLFYILYVFVEKYMSIIDDSIIDDLDDIPKKIKFDQKDYNILSSYFNKSSLENLQHINSKEYSWYSCKFIDALTSQYKVNGEKSLYFSESIHHDTPEFKAFVLEKELTNKLYEIKNKMTKSIKEKNRLKQIKAFEKGETLHLNSSLIKIKLIYAFDDLNVFGNTNFKINRNNKLISIDEPKNKTLSKVIYKKHSKMIHDIVQKTIKDISELFKVKLLKISEKLKKYEWNIKLSINFYQKNSIFIDFSNDKNQIFVCDDKIIGHDIIQYDDLFYNSDLNYCPTQYYSLKNDFQSINDCYIELRLNDNLSDEYVHYFNLYKNTIKKLKENHNIYDEDFKSPHIILADKTYIQLNLTNDFYEKKIFNIDNINTEYDLLLLFILQGGFGDPSQYKELLEETNDFDHIASHIKMISY